jgi:anti-sigma-K factor RskA
VATLAGSGKAARAEGWIVWSPGQRAGYIVVHFLPGVSADQQYQIWAVADDRSVPTAVFDVDDVGHAALMVSASVERPRRFVVTVEPRGGRAAPSGPIAMTGPVPW